MNTYGVTMANSSGTIVAHINKETDIAGTKDANSEEKKKEDHRSTVTSQEE